MLDNLFYFKPIKNIDLINKKSLVISLSADKNPKSLYSDNVWNFHNMVNSRLGLKVLNFNRYILNNGKSIVDYPDILNELKDYSYVQLNSGLKIRSVIFNTTNLFYFIQFFWQHKNSLSQIENSDVYNYIQHLKIEKKNYSKSIITHLLLAIKNLCKYRNDLSYKINFDIFNTLSIKKIVSKNNNFSEKKQTDIIPDDIWQQIINIASKKLYKYLENIELEKTIISHCNEYYLADINNRHRYFGKIFNSTYSRHGIIYSNSLIHLKHMSDTMTACGIIIQSFTGMRISELLSLKVDCIFKEDLIVDNQKQKIIKIKGKTYKYETEDSSKGEYGRETTWLCPPIVEDAILALETISSQRRYLYNYFSNKNLFPNLQNKINKHKDELFVQTRFSKKPDPITSGDISLKYKPFLSANGLNISNIKLTSHCFRRTLARFFARSLLKLPVDVLKEQFKHYSKDITHYYMKEDLNSDQSFIEMIEGYSNPEENNNDKNLLFSKISDKIGSSIMTSNNIDQLLELANGRQVKVVNNYMASFSDSNGKISALDCLTCDGIIIIPEMHIEFWKEMLIVYKEVQELEPNNNWYKLEMNMVEKIVKKLESNEVYITGVK